MSSYYLRWIKGICIAIASICLLIILTVASYYLWIPEDIPEVVEDRIFMVALWGFLAYGGVVLSTMTIIVRSVKRP